jgi:hypothetical protein
MEFRVDYAHLGPRMQTWDHAVTQRADNHRRIAANISQAAGAAVQLNCGAYDTMTIFLGLIRRAVGRPPDSVSNQVGLSGEADDVAGKGAEQIAECIDHERREALARLAKYTAPAMLAMLMSVAESRAVIVISGPA